jgi:Tfp pilus assembly protein PilW
VKISIRQNIDPHRDQQGFSLIELLIVCVIMIVILGIMGTVISGVQSNYITYRQRAAKHTDAMSSLNLMTQIIRNAGSNTAQVALIATGSNRLRVKADWTNADNDLNDPFEDVDFYVSNNTLYMSSTGSGAIELSQNIQAVSFAYYDVNGAATANMTSVARVKVTLTIAGEGQTLTANASIRELIQPK